MALESENSVRPLPVKHWDGSNYPSFAKLVNDCVLDCNTEIFVCLSDKARPCVEDVKQLVSLVEFGFGFVGLYRFGFFGFRKSLICKVGFLDERYTGGGFEDNDFFLRLRESNIAFYESEEIKFVSGVGSRWCLKEAQRFYLKKWKICESEKQIIRLLPEILTEEQRRFFRATCATSEFLPFDFSQLLPPRIQFLQSNWQHINTVGETWM